jgi:hypothetical protein
MFLTSRETKTDIDYHQWSLNSYRAPRIWRGERDDPDEYHAVEVY